MNFQRRELFSGSPGSKNCYYVFCRYCETIGLEGNFTNEVTRRREGRFDYKFKVRGKMYGEVDDAEVVLTTAGLNNPQDFVFTVNRNLNTFCPYRVFQKNAAYFHSRFFRN